MRLAVLPAEQTQTQLTNLHPYQTDITQLQKRIAWTWVALGHLLPLLLLIIFLVFLWVIYPKEQTAAQHQAQSNIQQKQAEYAQNIAALNNTEQSIMRQAMRSASYHPIILLVMKVATSMNRKSILELLSYDAGTQIAHLKGLATQQDLDLLLARLGDSEFVKQVVVVKQITSRDGSVRFALDMTLHPWQANRLL